ncbi:MAG: Asp-tRNA(Asn)/Glu-tRNA(Gln) amidotransferase subunit GatB [candidate division KSB1 bacterium]|nr:Asp-tRNA(Asn)/Glu-tRNA(Gln) amidotransferase subunit GatB [candidate division KSB1 bacterium]
MIYEPVIGLEIHIQLKTASKIFCGCSTRFGSLPNTQVCPVCLGLPGSLPVLNRRAVEYAARLALALNCRINPYSVFARKNFFYPDMPKGYQISQYELPFCQNGYFDIYVAGTTRRIGIARIHLEEDAGKSLHAESFVDRNETLIDLNRSGMPLCEVVTEPDFCSPQEAVEFLVRLRELVVFLGICDGNMEEGSLRCDANVSIRPKGEAVFGVKTELKNMNSFRAVEKALEYEIHRQELVLDSGGQIEQQTLLWDAGRNVASVMRTKEEAHDYRYFPDPDLVPLTFSVEQIEEIRRCMPELPDEKRKRFVAHYRLSEYDAMVLTESPELADYFEAAAKSVGDKKAAANWVTGMVMRAIKDTGNPPDRLPFTPAHLAELLRLLEERQISSTAAKQIFEVCVATGKMPVVVMNELGLRQVEDTNFIDQAIAQVLSDFPAEVDSYIRGNEKVFAYLMGQVMRVTAGKAAPQVVAQTLRTRLQEIKSGTA